LPLQLTFLGPPSSQLQSVHSLPVHHHNGRSIDSERRSESLTFRNNEHIDLSGGWVAGLRASEFCLPAETSALALEELYDYVLNDIKNSHHVDSPFGTLGRSEYRLGELHLVWWCALPSGSIPTAVIQQLLTIMRERARRGWSTAWEGMLLRDGQVWAIAIEPGFRYERRIMHLMIEWLIILCRS